MNTSKTQQKKEKLKELLWYICENYSHQLFETKLWKLLFFCDTDYFQKYNQSITDVTYIKNHHGPTPFFSLAKKATDELIHEGYIVKAENGTYVSIKQYPLKHLGSQQIDAINTTCDKYHKLTVNEICTIAHKDPIYLAAENLNDVLDFSFVVYRDDGTHEEDEDVENFSKVVSFSKKAQDNLLKMVTI